MNERIRQQHEGALRSRVEPDDLTDIRPIPRVSVQAFCESESVAAAIAQAGADRRMVRANVKVQMGGLEAAIAHYRSAPTPSLIIVETRLGAANLLASLQPLADVCDPTTKVVVVGHQNDVSLYRDLIRAGVSEYMVAPLTMADMLRVIATLYADPARDPLGRTLAFIGAKGGVGASTIAHNIGWSISSLFHAEVVIADLDLAFGTANIHFDQDPAQGIAEAVFSPERIDEVYLDRLLAQCGENLSLLAAPSTLERNYDLDVDSVRQVVDTTQRTAPYVVLDVPHQWSAWARSVLTLADEIIVVAEPELANLRNAKNLIDTLVTARPNDTPPRLVLNRTGIPKRPEIATSAFAEALGTPPLAVLPFEPQLFGEAVNAGRMVGELHAQHAVVESWREAARVLTGRQDIKHQRKTGMDGILDRLRFLKK